MTNHIEVDEDPILVLIEDVPPPFYTVAIYLCDRAYAGDEEGGWWYDYGIRQDVIHGVAPEMLLTVFYQRPHCNTKDQNAAEHEAYGYAASLQKMLDRTVNDDGSNRDLNSVNCEGRFCARVFAGFPPHHYPEEKPHYE